MSEVVVELMGLSSLNRLEEVGGDARFALVLQPSIGGEPHKILIGSRYGDIDVESLVRALSHGHLETVLEDSFGEPHRLLLSNIDSEEVSITDDDWTFKANHDSLPDWLHESVLDELEETERDP